MKDRSRVLAILFLVGVSGLVMRLFYWQIVRGSALSESAALQHTNRTTLSAKRGGIFSDDNSVLTISVPSWRLFLYRPQFTDIESTLPVKLSPFLATSDPNPILSEASESARLQSVLSNKEAMWLPLKNQITREQKAKIESLHIDGLGFDEVQTRMYPEASMSAHLLGFVGKTDDGADVGYFGLEGYYDLLLSGKSGVYETQANALGSPVLSDSTLQLNSYAGADLVTSINKPMQLAVEKRLQDGIAKYEAIAGSITVLDPKTGEVLAAASFPAYSPQNYFDSSDEFFRDPVISDTFEPGSIMKPIVMASAFDAGLLGPDTACDICGGAYHVGPYIIRTWNNQYFANTTMRDVIRHSDNVGMVYVGSKLGTDRLYDYLTKFGFGKPTNIDLQGEYGAPMRKLSEWGEVERDTASFGQGIAVTPIQMLSAISVIANNGVTITPHVVRTIQLGTWKKDKSFPLGTRVISESASHQMTDVMVYAVDQGEAKWAVPKGYEKVFAGKTGTAQVAVEGKYDDTKTNASFIGFGPANNPRFAMLVTLKQPKSSPWAAETAAPLWFQTAVDVMRYLGIPPKV
jgi:cell division protein FtsI/penicillin-binding protein 2